MMNLDKEIRESILKKLMIVGAAFLVYAMLKVSFGLGQNINECVRTHGHVIDQLEQEVK